MAGLALLNTAILTADGDYTIRTISLQEALDLLKANDGRVNSAVGHQSTADILATLLGAEVPVNRQMYAQAAGETALVFKVNGRAPEGAILDREQVEEIGYTLKALTRVS
jgi:rRNA maturation protein Rpf1